MTALTVSGEAALAMSPPDPGSPTAFHSRAHPQGCTSTGTHFLFKANTPQTHYTHIKCLSLQVSI